jgi:hypothetical protein
MYEFNLYYKSVSSSTISTFPFNLLLINLNLYSDENLSTLVGTLAIKSEILSKCSESDPNVKHNVVSTIHLDNDSSIIYTYLRIGNKTINPKIIYSTGNFTGVKEVTRTYLTDDLRKVTFTY